MDVPQPCVTDQHLDSGKPPWLDTQVHNYSHLLRVALPRWPALLAARADLATLCASSDDCIPMAASISPFNALPVEQLLQASASDAGAVQAAESILNILNTQLAQLNAREVLLALKCENQQES